MQKLLFILDNYYPHIGGAEKLFQNLAEELVKRGYDVTVFTPKSYPDYRKEEIHNGVRIVRQWVPGFAQRHFFTFFSIFRAISLARHHDLIHTTVYNSVLPAWLAAKITRRKVVITIHEVWRKNWFKYGDSKLLATVFYVLERVSLLFKFNLHICDSNSTMQEYKKLYPNRFAQRIYPGVTYEDLSIAPKLTDDERISLRRKIGIEPDSFFVFAFGRTGLSKGFEYLVEAVPMVTETLPSAKFMFVWPSAHNFVTMRDKLVSRLEKISRPESYQIHDKKKWSELLQLIQVADCVVVPSLSEGFGYVVVESCCVGDRVVASNTTSIPEVVGGNYILSEPGDPGSIANAILRMKANDFCTKPNLPNLRLKEWLPSIYKRTAHCFNNEVE